MAFYDGKFFGNAAQLRGLTGNLTNDKPVLIKGSAQTMLVQFKSDSVLSGRGFKANILYKPRGLGTWSFCSSSKLCQLDEGNCGHDYAWWSSSNYECAGGLKCGHDNCPPSLELSRWVDCCYKPKWQRCEDSIDLANGFISSPYYPNYYEPYQECSWFISVPKNKTITLEFVALDVSYFQIS